MLDVKCQIHMSNVKSNKSKNSEEIDLRFKIWI